MNENMAPFGKQLRGLVWRNFLIKRRQWKRSVVEIFTPLLLVAGILVISLGIQSMSSTAVDEFPPRNFSVSAFAPSSSKPILVSPDLLFTPDVMNDVVRLLNVSSEYTLYSDITSESFDEEYRKKPRGDEVGVEFMWKNTSQGLSVEGYVLRVPYEVAQHVMPGCFFQESVKKCGEQRNGISPECPGTQALTSGVLSLQWAVETALIQTFKDSGFQPPSLQLQMMPIPAFIPGVTRNQLLVCLSMVVALAPLAYFFAVTVVTERKSGIRVMFKVMGIRDCVFWLSWWLPYIITVLLVDVVATIMISLAGFLASSGLAFFFLMVFFYGISLLGLGSAVSVFFRAAKTAGVMSSLVSVLLGLLYLSVSLTRPDTFSLADTNHTTMTDSALPFGAQLVLSLFSPLAFTLGVDQAMFDHEQGADSDIMGGQFPVLAALLMLLLDAVLYMLLALYLDIVVPGHFRLPHKAWFCLTPSYWRRRGDEDRQVDIPVDTPEGPHIEPMSESLEDYRSIRIRDLSKKFVNEQKEPVYGLNGLDLDIYEGQVTCVLGHREAGKTTLMNILAGVMQPTSGVAIIYDLNASSVGDRERLTQMVSYCPQHNVLQQQLSVEEHLRIYAFLQGGSTDTMEEQITSCLIDLRLDRDRKTAVQDLSGCQKRRLSLALALLVQSKVLLLDEPTLGIEPEERRHVWNLLHSKKSESVILFTSRHMDEADYFSDRKVVLSRGRLRCVGSSQFLKEQFSVGYRLDLTVKPATSTERLLRAVKSHVRGANLVRCDDNQWLITIPSLQAAKLTALLKRLESKERGADYLGISEYALSMTTLEQVFWKQAEEEEAGNVFISPLLTPSEDTFADYDDSMEDPRRGPMFPSSLPRSMTSSQLEDVSRRFSIFPHRQTSQPEGSDGSIRRKSAFPRLQQRQEQYRRSVSEEEKPRGPGAAMSRRLSSMLSKSTAQNKAKRSSVQFSLGDQPVSSNDGPPRRSSVFGESIFKRRKEASKSLALETMKRSNTSHELDAMTGTSESPGVVEERPTFSGSAFPASLAARRATVAAFQDFRRSVSVQSNLSAMSGIGEHPTNLQDPMAKLSLYSSYEQARRISSSDGSTLPSVPSSIEETILSRNGGGSTPVTESQQSRPAKITEILANLRPTELGLALELKRLSAMLMLRLLVLGRDKCGVLLRVLVPVVLTLLAMGLSFATESLNPSPPQLGERIHLFGIDRLVYRNQTDENLDGLLRQFSRTVEGPEHLSQYMSSEWDPAVSLETLLDVLQTDGSSYRLHHNATCGLALPHLASFLAHVMRDSPTPTPVHSNNQAYLAPRVSAWLQPWPPVKRVHGTRTWDWLPVLCLGLALLWTPAAFTAKLVKERQSNLRCFLGVAGVGRLVYYGSAFIVDVVEFVIPSVILIVICISSEMTMFDSAGSKESLVLMVFLSVPVGILFAYTISFMFRRPYTSLLFMPLLVTLITVGSFCLVHFLDVGESQHTAAIIHYVFTILWPPYIRFGALHYIAKAGDTVAEDPPETDFFQFDSNVDICYIMLLVDAVLLSCLVLLLDSLAFRPSTLRCCRTHDKKSSRDDQINGEDSDVGKERLRLRDLHRNTDKTNWPWLVVEGLSKVFTQTKRRLRSLDQTTFTVDKGQVLGLLGPADAGKSTAMDIFLGLTTSSAGSVYINAENVQEGNWSKRNSEVGYCPQYNPLWNCLTVDHHVDIIGRVRGLQQKDIDRFRDSLYHDLDLEIYRYQRADQLSTCEKRKLSFALSMLGQQTALFLDEPTTGMEPRSRRLYWDAVNHFIKHSQRGALISTHNVEEAKALCPRLAIMVNGQLRCIGELDELKARFAKTYTLEVSLRSWEEQSGQQRMDMLFMFLRELFPGLCLIEQFHERAVFTVQCKAPDFSLASTFDTLESLKRNLDLKDFTFSQNSLEQTFLDFAREQREGDSRYSSVKDIKSHSALSHTSRDQDRKSTDTTVDMSTVDTAPQPRDAQDEGGASCQDAVSDAADAAVGVITVHVNGDDNGGGVAGVRGGGHTDAGAAAPVVFSIDGVDNLAYMPDTDDAHDQQMTSL